jgi:trans-aconitate methyltransferase
MAEFTAAVENYDRFMGRYAAGLAPMFADAAGVRDAGIRVLDVGCGPGTLAVELAARVGEASVAAIDPSPSSSLPAGPASRVPTCAKARPSRCPGMTAPSTWRGARWSSPG